MKRLAIGLAALTLSACASERHYSLDVPSVPPPPGHHAAPVQHPTKHVAQPRGASLTQTADALPEVRTAGPLKTAMIGSYMDAQERDFRAQLRGARVRVARIGDDLVLSLEDNVLFDDNDLSSDGQSVLERTAELLRHYDHTAIAIGGYTDTSGKPEQNMAVSEKRARLVADALISDGVAPQRVGAQGYGATHLRIMTGPDKSEPRNRRIEIRIVAHPQA